MSKADKKPLRLKDKQSVDEATYTLSDSCHIPTLNLC